MQPSEEALVAVIHRFVTQKKGPTKEPVTTSTALLQGGLLDSFNLVEMAQEIAREFEKPIPRGSLVLDDFETPGVLWTRLTEIWDETS